MKNNKKNIGILFFTLVIVMMGFGLVIPIFPFYIEEFGASGSALGFLMAIFALMQFIFSPIWGVLSDRFGRKPIILIGVFGYAISMLLFGLATKLWMLFFARALAGILSSATMPTAMAFIGDSTDEENRGGGMGM
ncbi:MAG: MFS transporter, partial [Chloroflexi bacterium]|nr:MFS transporter [Chloroflexota bacterium]